MMSDQSKHGSFLFPLFFLVLSAAMAGCSLPELLFPEDPIYLDHVDTLAVVTFDVEPGSEVQSSSCGRDMADELIQAIREEGFFKIVERQKIDQAIKELKLSLGDLFDENQENAVKLGKYIGAQALVLGRIKKYKYEEDPLFRKDYTSKTFWLFGDEKRHTKWTRKGRAKVAAYFRVVDATTAEIYAPKNYEPDPETESVSAVDNHPSSIDKDRLFRDLREEIVRRYASVLQKTPEN